MLGNYKVYVLAPHHEEWTVSSNAEPDAKNRIEVNYLQSDSRKHWDSGDMNRKGEMEKCINEWGTTVGAWASIPLWLP